MHDMGYDAVAAEWAPGPVPIFSAPRGLGPWRLSSQRRDSVQPRSPAPGRSVFPGDMLQEGPALNDMKSRWRPVVQAEFA
eukprot:1952096-Pyramimonas_sp.AAC.1